ncbi:MAG: phosphate ABC transporter permease subunit PstC [Oscillospiraceae bacterium]|nr:phosphate ABC transporter permease subunit PstC [Oscillospiraceae bacterium]
MQAVFAFTACISVIAVVLICLFLFGNGFPTMGKIGVGKFLFGTTWSPTQEQYGIFPMIVASIFVTAGAILIGVPIGVLCALFLAHYCPKRFYRPLKSAVELLAGIPSIVYGFFGLVVLVPLMQRLLGGSGKGMLTASIMLGIMILPTVINISESALRAVPQSYYEGSVALGADHERSVFSAVLPAARSGILAAVILGIGRAVGETMAVVMVAGNQALLPEKITDGIRTLTANIVLEMGYAADLHREALIACGVVLFVFILLINLCFSALKRRERG